MKTFDWENHYAKGGMSGDPKDYASSRVWKQSILHRYYTEGSDSILDVGCGDLQFWNDYLPLKYTGIDISQTIIDKHKKHYPNLKFYCSNANTPIDIKANVVICFDVLWHITDDKEYTEIIKHLCNYSNNYLYIFTWGKDPFNYGLQEGFLSKICKIFGCVSMTTNGGGHQKYRDFSVYSKLLIEPEFELIETHTNDLWEFGTMYIYRRKR